MYLFTILHLTLVRRAGVKVWSSGCTFLFATVSYLLFCQQLSFHFIFIIQYNKKICVTYSECLNYLCIKYSNRLHFQWIWRAKNFLYLQSPSLEMIHLQERVMLVQIFSVCSMSQRANMIVLLYLHPVGQLLIVRILFDLIACFKYFTVS